MTARTKVAPIKPVTLPRLELCAAALLARLVVRARGVLRMGDAPVHLWSDSTVALGWIRGHPATWKTYVANRVSEIQTSLPEAIWHHVPGRDNPADCASRGLSPSELVSHVLWWRGPPWLLGDPQWTATRTCETKAPDELPERRVRTLATASKEDPPETEILTRFSTMLRLLRVTAWCRRWLRRVRERSARADPDAGPRGPLPLQAEELQEARLLWIRCIQATWFPKEMTRVRKGEPLRSHSELVRLSPYLDPHGILRVGGRLRHSSLPHDQMHPAILPRRSHFTSLVVEDCHKRTLHGGAQLTLGTIRREYWIPRGRLVVKGCIHRCVRCLRWRAASPQPLMGDLPAQRVNPGRPFLDTGIDYAGPVWLRTSRGRGHQASKAFLAVFVCLSTRAVHLEVVSDYSANAFLAALRRFVSRRGLCRSLWSDCGTTFVGADTQLRELLSATSPEGRSIFRKLAEERIQWRFNPPAAPHFGGIWEAAVKSAKHHLRRVIGDSKLTFEEMTTLLAQVEACLNSRPLQAITDDPEDYAALTPGHFLVGSALNAVPEPSLADVQTSRLSRWQLVQQMRDHFWDRWAKEYLHTLMHRPKWCRVDEEMQPGRLCLVRNELMPPSRWPLARIERVHPGADGQVRVVDLRTATSNLTRPVAKLVLLPASARSGSGDCKEE